MMVTIDNKEITICVEHTFSDIEKAISILETLKQEQLWRIVLSTRSNNLPNSSDLTTGRFCNQPLYQNSEHPTVEPKMRETNANRQGRKRRTRPAQNETRSQAHYWQTHDCTPHQLGQVALADRFR